MDNKQPFARLDELKHPGMVVFLIITGILGLDLLIIVSGIDLITLSAATLISGLLIYLLIRLNRAQTINEQVRPETFIKLPTGTELSIPGCDQARAVNSSQRR